LNYRSPKKEPEWRSGAFRLHWSSANNDNDNITVLATKAPVEFIMADLADNRFRCAVEQGLFDYRKRSILFDHLCFL